MTLTAHTSTDLKTVAETIAQRVYELEEGIDAPKKISGELEVLQDLHQTVTALIG